MSEGQRVIDVVGTSVALVFQGDGDDFLFWDPTGMIRMAGNPEELGRKVVEVLCDPTIPRVDKAASPGGAVWVKHATKILDALTQGVEDSDEKTAVSIVVFLAADGESPDVVLWPMKGGPKAARGAAIGEKIASIVRDESQPKVPPGPAEGIAEGMMGKVAGLIGAFAPQLMQGEG